MLIRPVFIFRLPSELKKICDDCEPSLQLNRKHQRISSSIRVNKVEFNYNWLFIPEYSSAVSISCFVSWISLMNMPAAAKPLAMNPHSLIAAIYFFALLYYFLRSSIVAHQRFRTVTVRSRQDATLVVEVERRLIRLSDVTQISEEIGRFFGRKVRWCRLHLRSGDSVAFCDALYGYEKLRGLLARQRDLPVESPGHPAPDDVERIRKKWRIRHENFLVNRADKTRFRSNTPRVLPLIPLAFGDGMFNLICNVWLLKRGQADLIVYLAPISLIVSAMIARYISLYMMSSVVMNKRTRPFG